VKHAIEKQMEINKSNNLLYHLAPELFTIEPSFKNELLSLIERKEHVTEELIHETVNSLLKNIYKINQYINIDTDGVRLLCKLYKRTYDSLTITNFDSIMKLHYKCLSDIISFYYPTDFVQILKKKKEIGSVKNEEYTFKMQQLLYEINIGKITEPVIDIGCGMSAVFVNYLLKRNIDIVGIDRIVESPNERVFQADWLIYDFKPQKWGMIYSNMAFTNHLQHHMHNGENNKLNQYIIKYMEILNSLKLFGELMYAPSVIAIEERIDINKFEVTQKRRIGNISITKIRRIAI
jgi:hypothetical protein